MNEKARLCGILGVLAMFFGIVAGVMLRFDWWVCVINVFVGVLLLGSWGIIRFKQLRGSKVERRADPPARIAAYLSSGALICVFVMLNWLGSRPMLSTRFDFTEAKLLSLSTQSVLLLEQLKRPLRLVAFWNRSTNAAADDSWRDLLSQYTQHSAFISISYVDPAASPQLIRKYEMKPQDQLFLEYEPQDGTVRNARLQLISEEGVTNAIREITSGSRQTVYYVIGHAEPELGDIGPQGISEFAAGVQREGLRLEPLFLGKQGALPRDATIMLVSPAQPLLPEERDALIGFVHDGGRLFLLNDPEHPSPSSAVREIAAAFGIEVGEDIVIDLKQRLSSDTEPVVRTFAAHPLTKQLSSQDVAVFTFASTVRVGQNRDGAAQYTELLRSSPAAWGERDLDALFGSDQPIVKIDPAELQGELPLAVSYEKRLGERRSRVLVFGDSDWITNSRLKLFSNRDLALNAVSWISAADDRIVIRPKLRSFSEFPLQRSTLLILLGLGVVIPECILLLGVVVWWRRSKVA